MGVKYCSKCAFLNPLYFSAVRRSAVNALSSTARIVVFVPTEPASCEESVKEKEDEKERIINTF